MKYSTELFIRALKSIYRKLRHRMRNDWQRDLPLEELIFDRWERAKNLGFGKNSSIYHNSYVYGKVDVGQNTWIGPFTMLDGIGGLTIGSYCSISAGVQIYTHDSVKWALSGGTADYEYKPVRIGDFCYIGPQTVIAKGVTIEDHCVIGACSFVNSDVPAYSVVAGSPNKNIGKVNILNDNDIELIFNSNHTLR